MKNYKRKVIGFQLNLILILIVLISFLFTSCKKEIIIKPLVKLDTSLESKINLGKLIFTDEGLSNPEGQSCASCHSEQTAFSDPMHSIVSPGIVDGLFGNRNAPSIKYSQFIPRLTYDIQEQTFYGGLFWDGRVNSLEEQAKKPFFNPLEMNLIDLDMFVEKVKNSSFYSEYLNIYGTPKMNEEILDNVVDAISFFERSDVFNPFSSKFDAFKNGEANLTSLELQGMNLFSDTLRAKCVNCHLIDPEPISGKILFTDFTYDNIGVPKNSYNPFYNMVMQYNSLGSNYIDLGLYYVTKTEDSKGKFRVPSLRNIALTAPYFHNGVFSSLEEVVRFYNKRDSGVFGLPEINQNVNHDELGNLNLTEQEEEAIVSFLRTLTDGYAK